MIFGFVAVLREDTTDNRRIRAESFEVGFVLCIPLIKHTWSMPNLVSFLSIPMLLVPVFDEVELILWKVENELESTLDTENDISNFHMAEESQKN